MFAAYIAKTAEKRAVLKYGKLQSQDLETAKVRRDEIFELAHQLSVNHPEVLDTPGRNADREVLLTFPVPVYGNGKFT